MDNSARNLDFHLVAHLVVEQALCDRSGDGYLSFAEICLALADDGVCHLRLVVEIGHLHLRENLHAVSAKA